MYADQDDPALFGRHVAHETRGRIRVTAPFAAKADLSAIITRKTRLIEEFADDRIHALKDSRFTLYEERAAFLSPHEVQAGPHTLTAKAIIISTGSVVSRVPDSRARRSRLSYQR